MNFDLKKVLESKRVFRRDLAGRPVAEKLRLLDAMRERALAIRNLKKQTDTTQVVLHEKPAQYRSKSN